MNPHKKPIIDLNTDEKEVPSLYEIKPGVEKYLNKNERPRWNSYTETGGNIEHISQGGGPSGGPSGYRPGPISTHIGWKINDHGDSYRNNEFDDDFQPSFQGRPEIKPSFSKFRPTDEFIVSEYGRNNLYNDFPGKRPGTSTFELEYDAYPSIPNNYYSRRPTLIARQSKDNKIDETVKKYSVVSGSKPQAVYVKSPLAINTNCIGNNKNCNVRLRPKADYNSYFRPVIKRITTTTTDDSNPAEQTASSRMVKSLLTPPNPGYYPVYANTNKNYIRV